MVYLFHGELLTQVHANYKESACQSLVDERKIVKTDKRMEEKKGACLWSWVGIV